MTTALITGANKGIGYQTARLLGARGMTVLAGARNVTRGRTAEAALRRDGVDARFVHLDVTDLATIARTAAWIEHEYGQLDVLVNNAAIAPGDFIQPPSTTDLGTLREVFETNVYGIVALTNALLPLLRRAPAARIVNVSSEVGSIGAMMDPKSPLWPAAAVPYPASKTALNMVTAMYAKELWETPIKVNAANPGYCATDLNHNSGFRTAEQGAEVSVHLATLPADGPTGLLWGYLWSADDADRPGVRADQYGPLPW